MRDLGGVLRPSVVGFVEQYVDSLLAWDVVVFFHRNPDARVDAKRLSSKLGRHETEIAVAADVLCERGVLEVDDGHYALSPSAGMRQQVRDFAEAATERTQRLALIALVLKRMGHGTI